MRLQDLIHLDAAIEALAECADADLLFGMLFASIRDLFDMEAMFVWLTLRGEEPCLYRTEGVPALVAARLQRLKIPAGGERTVARRLYTQGYRAVLAAPLRAQGKMVGMIAAASPHSRRVSRTEATMFHLLVRNAVSVLARWRSFPIFAGEDPPPPMPPATELDGSNERTHLLHIFVSGMTHDLNNAMAAVSGRVELLLHRLQDQGSAQHLMAAQHAILEASQLIRHIHGFIGRDQGGDVMVDVNQLVQDSLQIARAPWFQGFRQRRDPVELRADLHPVPAFPCNVVDLRIALLCLLRHAMDTVRAGGGLTVHTSSVGEAEEQVVLVSLADGPPRCCPVEHGHGIDILVGQTPTPEWQLALDLVRRIVHNLHGQITVDRGADGGTATTLLFAVKKIVGRVR